MQDFQGDVHAAGASALLGGYAALCLQVHASSCRLICVDGDLLCVFVLGGGGRSNNPAYGGALTGPQVTTAVHMKCAAMGLVPLDTSGGYFQRLLVHQYVQNQRCCCTVLTSAGSWEAA